MTNGRGRQHGALSAFLARLHLARTGFNSWTGKNGLIAAQKTNFPPFSAATISVPKPFLRRTAEKLYPGRGYVLAPVS
jgi:hypothetical protein